MPYQSRVNVATGVFILFPTILHSSGPRKGKPARTNEEPVPTKIQIDADEMKETPSIGDLLQSKTQKLKEQPVLEDLVTEFRRFLDVKLETVNQDTTETGPGRIVDVLLQSGMNPAVVYDNMGSFLHLYADEKPVKPHDIVTSFGEHLTQLATPSDDDADEDDRFPQPSTSEQVMRICAMNPKLLAAMKGKFHQRPIPNGEILAWYQEHPGELTGTGLDTKTVSVDHIVPQNIGGFSHVFNYCLIPRRVNSKFGDRFDTYKRKYIGKQAVEIALGFSRWARDRSDVDLFKFNGSNFYLSDFTPNKKPKKTKKMVTPSRSPLLAMWKIPQAM
jgi:hypothetical protein